MSDFGTFTNELSLACSFYLLRNQYSTVLFLSYQVLWANILGRKNYEDNINVNWLQYRSHVLIYQKLLIHSVYNISISLKSRYTLHHITQVHFYFHAPHFCIAVLCFQVLYFYITFQICSVDFYCILMLQISWSLVNTSSTTPILLKVRMVLSYILLFTRNIRTDFQALSLFHDVLKHRYKSGMGVVVGQHL